MNSEYCDTSTVIVEFPAEVWFFSNVHSLFALLSTFVNKAVILSPFTYVSVSLTTTDGTDADPPSCDAFVEILVDEFLRYVSAPSTPISRSPINTFAQSTPSPNRISSPLKDASSSVPFLTCTLVPSINTLNPAALPIVAVGAYTGSDATLQFIPSYVKVTVAPSVQYTSRTPWIYIAFVPVPAILSVGLDAVFA